MYIVYWLSDLYNLRHTVLNGSVSYLKGPNCFFEIMFISPPQLQTMSTAMLSTRLVSFLDLVRALSLSLSQDLPGC